MADKVIWNEDKTRPFINPYNFVSTTQKVRRNAVEKGDLTGYITCTLRVEDMLALPDIAQNPNSQSFDFFPAIGNPIIPGSELRGCIRAAYEAVTESCFSVVNSEVLSARESKPKTSRKPGILMRKNNSWIIYEAEYFNQEHYEKYFDNIGEADTIRTWQVKGNTPCLDQTYFYYKTDEEGYIKEAAVCSDTDIRKLKKAFEIYGDNLEKVDGFTEVVKKQQSIIKKSLALLKQMETEKNNDSMLPVFYQCNKKSIIEYISPAHTGRKVFKNTVPSLLDNHKPCDGKKGYCPACSLFGSLGDKNPLASRLRFTDATEKESGSVNISDRYVILPELSSPKLSSPEFYSTCGDKTESVTVWDYDSDGVALRGRKFYFHGLPKEADVLGSRQIETKVAESGSLFTFKLYFDRIKEEQLQQLLWVLTIGDNQSDSKQMHKIGMGKPFGYGSVKITVDNICFRKFDVTSFAYSVEEKQYDEYMKEFDIEDHFDMKALSDFKTITNYSITVREDNGIKSEIIPISYPIAEREPNDEKETSENLSAGHQWFTGNRKTNNTFGRILPVLSSDIDALRLYALHGKIETVPDKNKKRSTGNGKRKPRVFYDKEKPYEAEIIGIHEENGEKMVDVTVCGENAKIKFRFFPKRIKNNIQKAIEEHETISVTFKFMSKKREPVFFVVPDQA